MWNFLDGYRLNPSKLNLLTSASPSSNNITNNNAGEYAYFRIHVRRSVLLDFAEKQSILLKTNPYSFCGGAPMVCSRNLEIELKKSCQDYMKHYPIPDEDSVCRGKNDEGFGFFLDVPEKINLFEKMIREGWIFGGCGIPVPLVQNQRNNNNINNGTNKNKNIIHIFFPLHNDPDLKEYEIKNGASPPASLFNLKYLFSSTSNGTNLENYFGGSGGAVYYYFEWLRQYILYLSFPSVIGIACGIVANLQVFVPSCFLAAHAIFVVIYMPSWIRKWERYENRLIASNNNNNGNEESSFIINYFHSHFIL